jgi:hypothetical protein
MGTGGTDTDLKQVKSTDGHHSVWDLPPSSVKPIRNALADSIKGADWIAAKQPTEVRARRCRPAGPELGVEPEQTIGIASQLAGLGGGGSVIAEKGADHLGDEGMVVRLG